MSNCPISRREVSRSFAQFRLLREDTSWAPLHWVRSNEKHRCRWTADSRLSMMQVMVHPKATAIKVLHTCYLGE